MKNARRSLSLSQLFSFLIGVFLLVISAASGVWLDMAQAAPLLQEESLSVNPTSDPPGSLVTLNGSGYTPGTDASILWDGSERETFTVPEGGSFSRSFQIPSGASPGEHQITVCAGCGQVEFEETASVSFTVVAPPTNTPIPTNTPRSPKPTLTPPPTNTTHPPTPTFTSTPTFTPSPTRSPTITPTPAEIPNRCSSLGFGPEAVVLDFEEDPRWIFRIIRSEHGIYFHRTARPATGLAVSPRSPSQALESTSSAEFGSIKRPITISFQRPVVAVGMFVGLEEAVYVDSEVTAALSVYGYRPGRRDVSLLGEDQVSFSPAPTDIEHCLRVVPEEGSLITKAVLEYRDAAGNSIAEKRLLDDLTLVLAGEDETLPPDQPPDLVINQPPADSYITDLTIPVRAEVTEDRKLRGAYYQINDSTHRRVTIIPVAGEPTKYQLAFNLSQGEFDPTRTNTLRVSVYDSALQKDREEVLINVPTPGPDLDLELVKFEAVQVVQCLNNSLCPDNSVPLLTGKPTMVRAYVRLRGGSLSTPISGRLCRGDTSTCTTVFVRPSNTILPDEDPNPVANDRGSLDATLNFTLPASWVERVGDGSLDLTLFVNYEGENAAEVDYANNRLHQTFSLREAQAMKVAFLRVQVDGVSPDLSERWDMADWLSRVFPVEQVDVTHPGDSGSILVDVPVVVDSLSDGSGGGCGKDWGRLMSELETLYRLNQDRTGSDTHYFGMVDQSLDRGGVLGCGQMTGWASASIVTPGTRFGAEVAAQELAHNKGLGHAPGIPGTCVPDGIDDSYPVEQGRLDAWGVDVTLPETYKPEDSFDYMGYCGSEGDTWTSVYTYMNMYDELPRAALSDQSALRAETRSSNGVPGKTVQLERVVDSQGLKAGEEVVLSGTVTDHPRVTVQERAIIDEVRLENGLPVLEFTEDLSHVYLRDSVLLYGNVAEAGHGETQQEILGSGDGTESQQERGQYLVGSGLISPDGVELVSGFYEVSLASQDQTPPGPFTVQLLTESGEELFQRDFRATHLSNDHAENVGTFYLTLPVFEDAHEIVFSMGDREIERITASAAPPDLQITSPAGGEDWGSGGIQTIAWEGRDPDGDHLQYSVSLSDDGGENWTTITTTLDEKKLELDSGDIGGGEVLIRILATDGFHTAEAILGEPVRVVSKSPDVNISGPGEGTTFLNGESIYFRGQAVDLEDGALGPEQLVWSSDQDGELGRGKTLGVSTLSVGSHKILLTAEDSDGNQASAEINLTIEERPPVEQESQTSQSILERVRSADPRVLLFFFSALVLLVIVGIGLLIFLGRRLISR